MDCYGVYKLLFLANANNYENSNPMFSCKTVPIN